MVSAAMAATVSPAASLAGKVPLEVGGIEAGALMSAMMSKLASSQEWYFTGGVVQEL
jgi:hypothetical protein